MATDDSILRVKKEPPALPQRNDGRLRHEPRGARTRNIRSGGLRYNRRDTVRKVKLVVEDGGQAPGAASISDAVDRGVYKALYRIGGNEVLVAIDSKGNRIVEQPYINDEEYETFRGALMAALDVIDPVFRPRLVH